MTCIVGLVEDGKVYIGGDSASVADKFDLAIRADEKVFRNGDYVMGFTSSFRMGQLLRYAFNPPVPEEGEDINRFMVTRFIDAVRQCLKDGGYASKKDETESAGTFLVGYKSHLFEIYSDYQVGIPADGYTAVGCGDQPAKGALFAAGDMPPGNKVLLALMAAENFSAGVKRPFIVLQTE